MIATGYVVAAVARNTEEGNGIAMILFIINVFLGGAFVPPEVMPDWLKLLANGVPLTYFTDALRQATVGLAPLHPQPVNLLFLAGWLAAAVLIARRFFRWDVGEV